MKEKKERKSNVELKHVGRGIYTLTRKNGELMFTLIRGWHYEKGENWDLGFGQDKVWDSIENFMSELDMRMEIANIDLDYHEKPKIFLNTIDRQKIMDNLPVGIVATF